MLTAYRAAWWMLAVAALVATTFGQANDYLSPTGRGPALAVLHVAHSLFMMAISWLLYRKCRRDRVAALLALALLVWAIADTQSTATLFGQMSWPLVFDRLRFGLFTFALFLFPSGRFSSKWARVAAGLTLAVATSGVVEAVVSQSPRFYLPLAIACLGSAIAALAQRFRTQPAGPQRQQLKWVALSLAAGFVLAVASRVLGYLASSGQMGDIDARILQPLLFDIGTMIMTSGLLVALLRYRLYDADMAISRSAAYAMLTVTLVAVFAGTEAIVTTIVGELFSNAPSAASGGIAAGLAALVIAPVHERVTGWADHRFRRQLTALREELPRIVGDLRESLPLPRFAGEVLERVESGVRCTRCALVVAETVIASRGAGDADYPDQFALDVDDVGTVGWLLVGRRADGSRIGAEEREALAEVVPAIARATFIITERVRREAEYVALARQVVERLDRAEARIAEICFALAQKSSVIQ